MRGAIFRQPMRISALHDLMVHNGNKTSVRCRKVLIDDQSGIIGNKSGIIDENDTPPLCETLTKGCLLRHTTPLLCKHHQQTPSAKSHQI